MEEKDILVELVNDKVVRVQRITKNQNGQKVNTPALILTFAKTTYPEHIKVGLLRVATRPYFPNPMLCYGCFSYGHTRLRCPYERRCFNCSDEYHGEECNKAPSCLSCKGDHRTTNRQCPVYKKEIEVVKIKVRDNLTFPEVNQQASGSYAQAAAQQNAIEQKLKKLETAMIKNDKEIARLLEESKRKDEKIAQMMAFIKQTKQQASQPKQNHTSETIVSQEKSRDQQRPVPTTTGPFTRSRNNSPAAQESKRGRPVKYNYNKPVTSPDLSPPPKKTAITHNPTEMDFSSEESEIPETCPSQGIR
ncbi:uncharacterized protein LOC134207066 [Armigeres subalbatus]|uniref:uncharacterized protein LOC134207066 n=1 Tax=Armigeres subalbatus TaxID=124917 RepID=UPI002ED57DDA